jgi:serine/threonine protein kinase
VNDDLTRTTGVPAAGVVTGTERPLPRSVGPYRILRLLGEGGMGTVYEAEQEHPRRTVALRARFDVESTLGASLAGQKRYADAELLLLSGYKGISRLEASIPPINKPGVHRTGEWIAALYQSSGQPAKAAEWRQQLQKP